MWPFLLSACADGVPPFDPSEWLPGGETTNTLLLGTNAFKSPAANLTADHEQDFYAGNAFFNQAWVEAPASTTARDGLGPLFNARSCSGCHHEDGKGAVPEEGPGPFVGLLLRVSVDGQPDPVLGGQIQDQALPDVPIEATPSVHWETIGDLRRPVFSLDRDPPVSGVRRLSPRLAPHMVGLGLLEAVSEDDLRALADPDDADGDGISGRVAELDAGVGRFGWKAEASTVERQTAGAFAGDMGLTSRLVDRDDCTPAQTACLEEPSGGEPEVDDDVFDHVVLYARSLAVPVRRAAEDEAVLRGRETFHALGCVACHTPSFTTSDAALPELSGQRIWPYTDLLLHDLGEDLSDHRPAGDASGSEWKTPPLWGLGLVHVVDPRPGFLHDGRARTLDEAVRWHGGEA
ncbi:MAG: thiol oxidoreductase, partial [Myxococcales bacterium]|nr:thiol oxidoreductase [Myxococcales bacterium]